MKHLPEEKQHHWGRPNEFACSTTCDLTYYWYCKELTLHFILSRIVLHLNTTKRHQAVLHLPPLLHGLGRLRQPRPMPPANRPLQLFLATPMDNYPTFLSSRLALALTRRYTLPSLRDPPPLRWQLVTAWRYYVSKTTFCPTWRNSG